MTTRQSSSGTDDGFTVVELLVVVIISAIIILPLGIALIQSLNFIPDSSERTQHATERDAYLLRFADDVAEAQDVRLHSFTGPRSGSDTIPCPPAGTNSSENALLYSWIDAAADDGISYWQYFQLRFAPDPSGLETMNLWRIHGRDWTRASVSRSEGDDRVLSGYCTPGSVVSQTTISTGAQNGTLHPRVTMAITLADTRSSSPNTVTFDGTPRLDCCDTRGPLISQDSLYDGHQFAAYYQGLTVSLTGTPPFVWSATGLPPGIRVDAAAGELRGTPTAAGTWKVALSLTDADGLKARRYLSLTVTPYPMPSITTSALPVSEQSIAYSATLAGTSGTGPYTWSATGLPNGVTLNANSGSLSGTPTASGTFTVDVTLTDAVGVTATRTLTLRVYPALAITGPATLAASTVNHPYASTTIVAGGGSGAYSWSATGLPAGIAIDATSGALSGTPTATGTFSVDISVTDTAVTGATAVRTSTLVINPRPSISTTACTAKKSTPLSTTLGATGGTGSITWSASGHPAWASVNAAGQLSGTAPNTVGTPYSFTLTATDAVGAATNATFQITVIGGAGTC